jgi:hypothetical protein
MNTTIQDDVFTWESNGIGYRHRAFDGYSGTVAVHENPSMDIDGSMDLDRGGPLTQRSSLHIGSMRISVNSHYIL